MTEIDLTDGQEIDHTGNHGSDGPGLLTRVLDFFKRLAVGRAGNPGSEGPEG